MFNYNSLFERCRSTLCDKQGVSFLCLVCGLEHERPELRCNTCGGAIDAFYNLDKVELHDDINPMERYFDLLPVRRRENLIWTGEGNTPLLEPFELRAALGLPRLYLKNETANPTSSTKDRMAAVAVSVLKEHGVKSFAISSTGNSSTSFVRAVQLAGGLTVYVFVGKEWLDRLNYNSSEGVHTYSLETSFADTGVRAAQFAKQNKIHSEGGFFNLARREGLKLAYLEAFDQMPETPEYVFQAISSGMGLLGGFKGAIEYKELRRLSKVPRFFGVQQDSCAPIARAYNDGHETMPAHYVIEEPKGIAKAILRGNATQAYPYIRTLCMQSGGGMVRVSDDEIFAAADLVKRTQDLTICNASAACFAGMIKLVESNVVDRERPILVMLTGRDRPNVPRPTSVRHFSKAQVMSGEFLAAASSR